MRIGAGQIGLQHQLGDLAGVDWRHAGLDHRVADKAGDGHGGDAIHFGRCIHFGMPARNFSKLPLRIAVLSASEIFSPRTWLTQSSIAMS